MNAAEPSAAAYKHAGQILFYALERIAREKAEAAARRTAA